MDWNNLKNIYGLKNISKIGAAHITGYAISSLFWLYLADILGEENYGKLGFFLGIAGVASAISLLGGQHSITVYVAKGLKIQPPIFVLSLLTSITAGVILLVIFSNIGLTFYVVGYVIFNLTMAELLGRKFYNLYSKYFLLQKILLVVLSLSLLTLFDDILAIILGIGLSFLPLSYLMYKSLKNNKIEFQNIKSKFGFIMNNYILDLGSASNANIDKLLIGPLLGFAVLGNYYLSLQFLAILGILPGIIFKYTLPEDSSGTGSTHLIKKLSIILSIGLALIGMFVFPYIIEQFFPEYSSSKDFIVLMSLAIIPQTIQNMSVSSLLGKEKSRYVLTARAIWFVVFVGGIFLLGEFSNNLGLAISFLIASCISALITVIVNFKLKN
tara:strand:- start:2111 stop:3262 length:1152 start_codon:yes stop_codon:yes gene_type:complete